MKNFFNSFVGNNDEVSYVYPSWWTGTQIPVTYDNNGIYHNYDVKTNVSDLFQTVPYYVSTTGSNSNNGLSNTTPFATLEYAHSQGAKLIYMLSGTYNEANGHLTSRLAHDMAVVGIGTVSIEKPEIDHFEWFANTNTNYRLYLENMSHNKGVYFLGHPSSTTNVYLKNIRNLEPTSPDGIGGTNGIYANSMFMILQNCISSNSNRDNFNYHNTQSAVNYECIEIDCVSENPSNFNTLTNNQCSTAHEGMMMLRIGGTYLNGNAQVIADVNLGGQSVLIGCEVNQQKAINNGGDTILYVVDGETFKCDLLGSTSPLNLTASNGGTLTLRDTNSEHTTTTGNVVIIN